MEKNQDLNDEHELISSDPQCSDIDGGLTW